MITGGARPQRDSPPGSSCFIKALWVPRGHLEAITSTAVPGRNTTEQVPVLGDSQCSGSSWTPEEKEQYLKAPRATKVTSGASLDSHLPQHLGLCCALMTHFHSIQRHYSLPLPNEDLKDPPKI